MLGLFFFAVVASGQFPASNFYWVMNQTLPAGDGDEAFIVQSDIGLGILTLNTTQSTSNSLVYADAFVSGSVGGGTCGFDPSSGFAVLLHARTVSNAISFPATCARCARSSIYLQALSDTEPDGRADRAAASTMFP
jgi:hypothetical protein